VKLSVPKISWLLASLLATACLYQKLSVGSVDDGSGGTGTAGAAGSAPNSSGTSGDTSAGGSANGAGTSGVAGEAGDTSHAGAGPAPPTKLTLLAGQIGGCGFVGGVASSARLPPATIVWDSQAYLYAFSAYGIQKIAVTTGTVTIVSSTPIGTPTAFILGAVADATHRGAFVALSDATVVNVPFDGSAPTVLAGAAGQYADTDGKGSNARFAFAASAVAMTVDDSGNLFLAESVSQVIRELDTVGMVTTVAGKPGITGSDDGLAATFNGPLGLAAVGSYVYISDWGNRTFRQLDTGSGNVSLIAGATGMTGTADGGSTDARFVGPGALAYDPVADSILVADGTAIRSVSLSGFGVTTVAGQPSTAGSVDGTPTNARFQAISSIAVDDAYDAFIGDSCAVRKYNGETVSTLAGSLSKPGSADGAPEVSGLWLPAGVAADGDGQVFVADSRNDTIRQVDVASATMTTLAGYPGEAAEVDAAGAVARFTLPWGGAYAGSGVTSDSSGHLFVADSLGMTIRQIVTANAAVTTIGGAAHLYGTIDGQATAARFYQPAGIVYDNGALYIVDVLSAKIRKLDLDARSVSTLAGGAAGANVDGFGVEASFNFLCASTTSRLAGIAADSQNLYVSDCGDATIRKIDETTGEVTTFAGSAGLMDTTDGVGTDARFEVPLGIASDGKGNLYVADGGASTLRKIVIATGVVSTVLGTPNRPGVILGRLPAGLNVPTGVAVLPDGSLAITDPGENALLWFH
jgi:hypothetical protein